MAFLWLEWNLQKIDNHGLSFEEVEFAWNQRVDLVRRVHLENGEYWESRGKCPSGKRITMIWRYDESVGSSEKHVFVITAY